MGVGYQTAAPVFVDNKMLQLPYQAMAQAIDKIDAEVDTNLANVSALQSRLQANALQADKERLNQIFQGYESRIQDISSKIAADPMQGRKMASDIRQLGQELHKDFTRGEIAAIQGNYNAFQSYKEDAAKRVKDGDILQSDLDKELQRSYADFAARGGTDFAGGRNSISPTTLYNYVDVEKYMEENAEDMKATIVEQGGFHMDPSGVIWEDESRTKKLTPQRIKQLTTAVALQNKPLQDYYGQQINLGFLDEEDFMNTIDNASSIVAGTFMQDERKYQKKFKGWDPIKIHKAKKDIDEGAAFNVNSTIIKGIDGSNFTTEDNNTYIEALDQSIADKKADLNRLWNSLTPEEISKRTKELQTLETNKDNHESIKNSSKLDAMFSLLEAGKITTDDYNNYESYMNDQLRIDSNVQSNLDSIREEAESSIPQITGRRRGGGFTQRRNAQVNALQKELINEKLASDPEFADDYNKYMLNQNLYNMNEGGVNQIFDGLQWETQTPNTLYDKSFKKVAETQGQTYKVAAIGTTDSDEDQQTRVLLNDMMKYNSSDITPIVGQQLQFKDGKFTDKSLKASIDPGFWQGEKAFTPKNIIDQTGKQMDEVFDYIGVTSSGDSGTRIVYRYNSKKAEETGLGELDGVQDGETIMFQVPDSGIEAYLYDTYGDNMNPNVRGVMQSIMNPRAVNLVNEFQTSVAMSPMAGVAGPEKKFKSGDVVITVSQEKDADGKTVYNIKGFDQKLSKNLPEMNTTDAATAATDYIEYINSKR